MLQNFRAKIRGASQRARRRHEYAAMLDLDDHLLRDIGIRREAIRARMAGPNAGA